ncbi:MAG: replicative DNA helicase [Parcubacteria group bacterium CG11_big_fil_rev_8_21_14_0_20_39_14]|nr:MAG: replicative DNA helicase [Parcubacteria group bacterium CG11_big_fil_rev_8_21_14_0_20_39_14]PIS35888.1 MAG: replicative DNA helicase [Parcubacteria group bacterium CG08_land_8_20_14_0_20_38_56]
MANIKPGQLPPQDIEAEQSVLGSLMLDKNAIFKIADWLTPDDFYRQTHKIIYQATLDLFEKSEPIDLCSLPSRLKEVEKLKEIGGKGYLTELINSVPTATHVIHYAKIVQRKKALRDLIEAAHEINLLGYQEEEDIESIVDEAEQKIFSISQKSLRQDFIPVKDILGETFERIDRLHKGESPLRGLQTGFSSLDNKLAGLQKSDLIILASRPSLGKSALALDIARHVATQVKMPVGIFSLEMSRDQIVDRLIAGQARIDLWRLRTGKLSKDNDDFSRLQYAINTLSKAPIYIDDAPITNVMQMRAMTRRLQASQGLGLIIVDYLQLMEPRTTFNSMVQQITEISRALKSLARELNIPVLALSQLSRAVEQRTPQVPRLSDLRESGCLAGDTLLTRADTGERVFIKNLVGQTDIPIYSLDENWKIKERKISKVFSSGKKMIYELKTRSGFKIKASANHPFQKIDGWYRLDQLAYGDYIATPRKLASKSPKNELSKEEIILLAHLLGDGCVLPGQPIHYTSGDLKNIKIVAKLAKKLFQIKPRIVRQKNWWHVYLPSPYRLARKKHHPIINWYYALKIQPARSWEKEIPQKIFGLDEENLSLFLKHLWATDGNISHKYLAGIKPSGNIYYSSTSEKIAEGVKHLLLKLGIRSRISPVKKANYRICYHISIQGKKDQLNFLQKIGSYGKRGEIVSELIKNIENIETNPNVDVLPKEIWGKIALIKMRCGLSWRGFAENYGMSYCGSALFKHGVSKTRLTQILNFLPSLELKNLAESDVFWDEIVSITPLEVEEVYDATVPETHNFVANDIVVHNSLEQDSDVVLFIHRKDKYDQKAEKNLAEIIIAKHRNGPIGKTPLYFDENYASFIETDKTHIEDGGGETEAKDAEDDIY